MFGLFRRRAPETDDLGQKTGDAKTVLIVEDNKRNLNLFEALLEGHSILHANNGVEAIDLAREHRPDLILMDIQLPWVSGRSFSGLDATKCLKEDEELCTIPVIVVTAFAMKDEEEKIRESGCEAYLFKPVSVPLFEQTVGPYLN